MASRHPKDFKNRPSSVAQQRKRRAEEAVQLHKSRRDEEHLKRRNLTSSDACMPLDDNGEQQDEAMEDGAGELQVLPECVTLRLELACGDAARQLDAARQCRAWVSTRNDEGIDYLVKGQFVEMFVQLIRLHQESSAELVLELVRILTNIASGPSECTAAVVSAGAVPPLILLLGVAASMDEVPAMIVEQTLWALGNIAGDNSDKFAFRRVLLEEGVVPATIRAVSNFAHRVPLVRNAVWLLSNLCRANSYPPDFEHIKLLVPVLVECVQHSDDEILTQAGRAIGSLASSKYLEARQELVHCGAAGPLVACLRHRKVGVVQQALRSLGSLLSGDDESTQVIIDAGILSAVRPLLSCDSNQICKDALRAISNITAGNRQQIQSVINAGIFPKMVKHLRHSNREVVKEALWSVGNIMHGGSREQMSILAGLDCPAPLADLLKFPDADMVCATLDTLGRFLKLDEAQAKSTPSGTRAFASSFTECNGVDTLWKLVDDENDTISEMADHLLTRYFADL